MLKLESKDLTFTLKSCEWYLTKQNVKCLKVKGTLNNSVYITQDSNKAICSKNYFGKILIFGDERYLQHLCETLWLPQNENGIGLVVKECYCELPYFNGKVFTTLYIVDSDLKKKKFFRKEKEKRNLLEEYKLKEPKSNRLE